MFCVKCLEISCSHAQHQSVRTEELLPLDEALVWIQMQLETSSSRLQTCVPRLQSEVDELKALRSEITFRVTLIQEDIRTTFDRLISQVRRRKKRAVSRFEELDARCKTLCDEASIELEADIKTADLHVDLVKALLDSCNTVIEAAIMVSKQAQSILSASQNNHSKFPSILHAARPILQRLKRILLEVWIVEILRQTEDTNGIQEESLVRPVIDDLRFFFNDHATNAYAISHPVNAIGIVARERDYSSISTHKARFSLVDHGPRETVLVNHLGQMVSVNKNGSFDYYDVKGNLVGSSRMPQDLVDELATLKTYKIKIAFRSDGSYWLTVDALFTLSLYASDNSLIRKILVSHVLNLSVLPSGNVFACGGSLSSLWVYQSDGTVAWQNNKMFTDDYITAQCALSEDEILLCLTNNRIRVLSLKNNSIRPFLKDPCQIFPCSVAGMGLTRDLHVIMAHRLPERISVWTTRGERARLFSVPALRFPLYMTVEIGSLPNGQFFIYNQSDGITVY